LIILDPWLTDEEKKLHGKIPMRRKIGKSSPPREKIIPNTSQRMSILRRGSKKDQRNPKTEPR
jgi:hypothetical protein